MKRLKKVLISVAISMATVNANAWPWISPYAYCGGNPVNAHRLDLVAGDGPVSGAKLQATSNEWSSGHSITNFMQYVQSLPVGKYKVVNGQIVPQ